MVTAADRAAATFQLSPLQGAKVPEGRSQSPLVASAEAKSPRLPPQRELSAEGWISPLVDIHISCFSSALRHTLPCLLPQKEGDHSLCKWWRIYAPSTKKTMATAIAFFMHVPLAACPRRLCQPPWTQPTSRKPRPTLRRNQARRSNQLKRQPLFGRSGLSPRVPFRLLALARSRRLCQPP